MSELDKLRELINDVDSKIIELLSERRKLSKDIIREKDDKNSPIRDQNREEALLKRIIKLGKEQNVDPHFLTKVFYEIIEDSVRIQQSHILNPTKEGTVKNSITVAIQG
ncbi:hypothetical protein MNBD_IGNAVI01-1579, partial [hydrothermal vent metagenome]